MVTTMPSKRDSTRSTQDYYDAFIFNIGISVTVVKRSEGSICLLPRYWDIRRSESDYDDDIEKHNAQPLCAVPAETPKNFT